MVLLSLVFTNIFTQREMADSRKAKVKYFFQKNLSQSCVKIRLLN